MAAESILWVMVMTQRKIVERAQNIQSCGLKDSVAQSKAVCLDFKSGKSRGAERKKWHYRAGSQHDYPTERELKTDTSLNIKVGVQVD
ncbi:Homoserine O-acetyltransferase [Dissostichus eleginoides]|uniref:Homoserine O-acetyltransferase n=1 Tax=Dissostichus eleginoides TaxID=100907 RepID=A0AAD9F498_DISEL|nr:Homoserine O-acetyltransferase [Dissostichus eleginoides]